MSELVPFESDLVKQAQMGDPEAFGNLCKPYRRKLLRMIRGRMWDDTEAEDVCQEALLCAWRALRSFRGECAFYTWLYRIGVNTTRRYLRKQYSVVEPKPEEVDLPERMKLRAVAEIQMLDAIGSLPDNGREVLTLYEVAGLSYVEISEALGIPIGTVRSRISTARKG